MNTAALFTVFLAVIATAIAFECKQCMHMATDNEDVNNILDSSMESAMGGSPITYTTDCRDNAASIQSSTCPTNDGCMSMKINAAYAMGDQSMNMEMYMRMCGGGGQQSGCQDLSQFEGQIRDQMGAGAEALQDMSGVGCVCEGENCNVRAGEQLSLTSGGGGSDGGGSNDGGDTGSATAVTSTLFSLLLLSVLALLL